MCSSCKTERTEDMFSLSVIRERTLHPADPYGAHGPWHLVPRVRINGEDWIDLSTKEGLAKFLNKFGL